MSPVGRLKASLHWLTRHQLHWAALLVLLVIPVYYRTLLPGLGYWGDSAKFQFVGKVLGIVHVPGNPLYLLLNHVFVTLLPKGSLAFRANLLSMCFSLAALLVLFNLLVLLRVRPLLAFIATLMFAFTFTFWLFALVTEVYSLHILLVVLVINLLVRWRQSRHDRLFYAACGAYAISFGNHQGMAAMLPAIIYLVWVTDRRIFWNPRKILAVAGLILLGLSLYLYIPWRANNPETAFVEIRVANWLDYWRNPGLDTAFHLGLGEILTGRLPVVWEFYWKNFYVLLLLFLGGIFSLKDRSLNVFLLLYLVVNTLLVLQLDFSEAEGLYLPGFLVVAVYIGLFFEALAARFLRDARLSWLLLLIPAVLLLINYRQVDQSGRIQHALRVEKMVSEMDSQALVIADDYEYAAYFWYYLIGEGKEERQLYALPDYAISPDTVIDYLAGKGPIELKVQQKNLPPGLAVYVMAPIASKLDVPGLSLEPTGSKYLYRIRLSGGAWKFPPIHKDTSDRRHRFVQMMIPPQSKVRASAWMHFVQSAVYRRDMMVYDRNNYKPIWR